MYIYLLQAFITWIASYKYQYQNIHKMNVFLKRIGLSDTEHELWKSDKHHQQSIKINNPLKILTDKYQSNNPIMPEWKAVVSQQKLQHKTAHTNLLKLMIDYLTRKSYEQCTISEHENNIINFICLDENCPKKIGCSHCFLHNHSLHTKIQTKTCLKNLKELDNVIKKNHQVMQNQLQKSKKQIISKINAEIQQIRSQFQNNMRYLSTKIFQKIQETFSQKLKKFNDKFQETQNNQLQQTLLHQYVQLGNDSYPQTDRTNKTKIHMNNSSLIINFENIASKFKQEFLNKNTPRSSRPHPAGKNNFSFLKQKQSQHKNGQSINKQKQKSPTISPLQLSKQQEENLLVKICRMNINYVQQYLNNEFDRTEDFINSLVVYQQFYSEMYSSVGEFFSAFKRAIPLPKICNFDTMKPQLLKSPCYFFERP